MKNIVFFVESMHCGGAERSLLSLLANIDQSKYKIDLLVINKGGEFEKFIPSYVTYKSTDTKFGFVGRLKYKLFRKFLKKRHNAQFFWKAFKGSIPNYEKKYDIAVAWGQGFATYFTAEKILADKKFAWVNIDYEKAGYKYEYDQHIYQKFKRIVGVSDFVKESMQKFIPLDKVTSIRNIIDIDDVIKRANADIKEGFNADKINIVSIGRLAKQKAFDLSIEAAKILNERKIGFCWYIIGEGSERDYLESLIVKYGLEKKIKLLGFRDNPYPYVKNADIYVQTSLFEGLGRTLIEASILCKPVVTTNFPTAFGILRHNETGIITEMEPNSIASSIISLIDNPDLKEKIITNLKNQVDNEKEITLQQIDELFNTI